MKRNQHLQPAVSFYYHKRAAEIAGNLQQGDQRNSRYGLVNYDDSWGGNCLRHIQRTSFSLKCDRKHRNKQQQQQQKVFLDKGAALHYHWGVAAMVPSWKMK